MPAERNRRLLFISGIGLGQRLAQLLSTLITFPLLLHVLGVAGFGVWGAATSLVWLSSMFDLGLGGALISLLPAALAAGDEAAMQCLVGAALVSGLALSVVALGVGGACLALGFPPHAGAVSVIIWLGLAFNIPANIARDIWFGLHKGYAAGYWDFAQTLLTLVLLVTAALIGTHVTMAVAIVFGVMLLTNTASLVHVFIAHPALRPRHVIAVPAVRDVLSRGALIFAATVAGMSAYAFDSVLALLWLGPAASAQMVILLRVCTTAIGFLNVVSEPLWPAFVEAAAQQDRAWARRALLGGSLGLASLAFAGSAVLIAYGAPVLRWWLHRDLHLSSAMFWLMGGWIVVLNLPRVPSLLLNAVLVLRAQVVILAATTLAGFVLKYFAARAFGVAGILGVTPVLWLIFVAPAYGWLAWRRVRTSTG